MEKLLNWLKAEFWNQWMVEYGLIIAFMGVFLIVALMGLKDEIAGVFGKVVDAMN